MIKVHITDRMKRLAKNRDQGVLNDLSFMRGKGNFTGFLGEEIVAHELSIDRVDKYDYDFIHNGQKIEVKTKTQTVPIDPLPHYEASVAETSMFQDTDIYIFCRVYKKNDDYKHGWIIGWISKDEFLNKSRFLRKGEYDPDNGYVVRSNCYNIRYDELNQWDDNRSKIHSKPI